MFPIKEAKLATEASQMESELNGLSDIPSDDTPSAPETIQGSETEDLRTPDVSPIKEAKLATEASQMESELNGLSDILSR